MTRRRHGPPRLAQWILARMVPPAERDMVLGDLEEILYRRAAEGRKSLGLWYWLQVCLFSISFTAERVRGALGGPQLAHASPQSTTVLAQGRINRQRGGFMVGDWMRAFGFALRTLRRHPGFAALTMLTLALGIGANTAIFSVIHGSLLRPLPYRDVDRLIWISEWYKEWDQGGASLSPGNYLDLNEASRLVPEMAVYAHQAVNLATEEEPVRALGTAVSHEFFGILGIEPRLGRDFTEEDDQVDAEDVMIITDGLWRERYGTSPDILGKTAIINSTPYTIIGVLPPDFTFMSEPSFYVPTKWGGRQIARGGRSVNAIGKMAPGVEFDTAWDELKAIYARLEEEYPANQNWTVWISTLQRQATGRNRSSLLLLGGAVGLVLLIACVNVANLLLVRAEGRQRELAVRFALGSGRYGLIRVFLSESLLIALTGGALGIFGARWGVRLLKSLYGASLSRADAIGLNVQVLAFGLGVTLLTGLAVGLVPALRVKAGNLQHHLREGARGSSGGRSFLKQGLVISEVALAVMLVAGAGLLVNSFYRLTRVELGLADTDRSLTFRVAPSRARYQDAASIGAFYEALTGSITAMAGVQSVGLSNRPPLAGGFNITNLYKRGDQERVAHFVELRYVTSGYFDAVGIPLVKGRAFSASELHDPSLAIMINERTAQELFGVEDPIGQFVDPGWNDTGFEVIGVVGSIRDLGPEQPAPPAMFFPFPAFQAPLGMLVTVRTAGDPFAMVPRIREAVKAQDPELPVYSVRTVDQIIAGAFGNRRFSMSLLTVFAALALLLGAIGIYGVMSYTVAQRTREMGVRIALGARSRDVRNMVIRRAVGLAGAGVILGLIGALASGRFLTDMLFEVDATDPLTHAGVAVILLAVSLAASYVPAWRATKVDPITSMRSE